MPINSPPPSVLTDTPYSGSIPAQPVRVVPDDEPDKYLTVRLSNGATFYNAGGTSISGGTGITSDQGSPTLVSSAWPIKVTDGSNVYGPVSVPFNVVLSSGSVGLGTTDINNARVLKVDVVQSVANTVQSGSVIGLLQGGQPTSMINPIPITGSVYVLNQSGAGSNVTSQSGSITGLLVGGVALSNANPVPISDAGGTITVDGTVTVTSTVINSGSVTGHLVGGVALSNANPFPISDAGSSLTVDGTVTTNSGSLVGILVGGLPLSNANPFPISDAGGVVTVDGTVTVASTIINTGSVTGLLQGGQAVSNANPIPISDAGGTITIDGTVTVASTVINTGSITGLLVGGVALSSANPIPISDAGGTITVDGSVIATVASTVINSGSVAGLLQGGQAVSMTNPIPVTGSVYVINQTVTVQSGSLMGHLVGGVALSNANPFPISDAGGSLTTDQGTGGSVTGTPWTVVLTSGSDTVGHPSKGLHATSADRTGLLYQDNTQRTVSYAYANATGSGNTPVVAAQGSGNKVRVVSAHVMTSGSVGVKFQSATTDKTALYPCRDGGGFVLPYNPHGWFETAGNEALNINLSSAIPTAVTLTYIVVI